MSVLKLPGEVTSTGLVLPEDLSVERWLVIGEQLRSAERSLMWWIGDWLRFGERKYGDTYSQALEATGLGYQALANAKYVAEKYPDLSLRKEDLSWSHHHFAAALPAPERSELLERAARDELSAHDVRREARHLKGGISEPQPVPDGQFSLIYADPPWRYEHSMTDSRKIENQYPTMELEEICALGIPAADDSVLFLWATSPKLSESMRVIDAWGFVYRTCAVWDKEVIGMGYYFRQQHELLLVATRGAPRAPEESVRESSVIRARRGQHSEKPAQVYELLERMYPAAVRLEMFARAARAGWATWGNMALAA